MLDKTIESILKRMPIKVIIFALFFCSIFVSFIYNIIHAKLGWPRMPETWLLVSTIILGMTITFVVYYLADFIYTKHKAKKKQLQSEHTIEDLKNDIYQITDNLNYQEIKVLNELISDNKEFVESEFDLFEHLTFIGYMGKKYEGEEIINTLLVKPKYSYWIIDNNFKNSLKLLKEQFGQISRFDKGEK